MKKNFFKILLNPVTGKKYLYPVFEKLNLFSLYGMNYGGSAFVENSGEKFVANFILNENKNNLRDSHIFDVGANYGQYAKMVKGIFGDKVNLHSFEPSPSNFTKLINELKGFKFIKINNFGLADEEKCATLFRVNEDSGLSSIYNRDVFNILTISETETISLKTIDQYCIENFVEKILFLKLDIEGAELSCLKGASKMITENKIKYIQFEFGGCNIDSKTYFKDFWSLLNDKYNFFRVMKDGLIPIKKYSELLEVFVTTNFFLAIK